MLGKVLGEVLGDLDALPRQEVDGPRRSWRVRRLYCRVIDEDVPVHGSKAQRLYPKGRLKRYSASA